MATTPGEKKTAKKTTAKKAAAKNADGTAVAGTKSRKTKRTEGRNKRKAKLKTDKEFAKTYFEGKSKRANDKKAGFRKKKRGKK